MTGSPATPGEETGPARSRIEILLIAMLGLSILGMLLFQQYLLTSTWFPLRIQFLLIFRLIIAFQGAAIGLLMTGFLSVGNLPLRASGALAIFVVLFFWNP